VQTLHLAFDMFPETVALVALLSMAFSMPLSGTRLLTVLFLSVIDSQATNVCTYNYAREPYEHRAKRKHHKRSCRGHQIVRWTFDQSPSHCRRR
jgi:hypothetical protein